MGDEQTQTQQEPAWWALDAVPEGSDAAPPFESPVEWPDAMAWERLFEGEPAPPPPVEIPGDLGVNLGLPSFAADAEPPGELDDYWATVDGGEPTELRLEPLPDSIWAPDPRAADDDRPTQAVAAVPAIGAFGGGTEGAPVAKDAFAGTPAAGPRRGPVAWLERFDVRHGNAVVIALVSCVSLVLLGMFLSVRARDNLPTETSKFGPTGTQVATDAQTTSVPRPTIPPTSLAPPSTISLSDLIPPDAAAGAAAGGTGGGAGATGGSSGTPATTAAPARSGTAPAASSAATQPVAQPTNTTTPQTETTSPTTTTPVEDTTTTPTSRRPTPTVPDFTIPSIPFPTNFSIPPTSRPPGFPAMGN